MAKSKTAKTATVNPADAGFNTLTTAVRTVNPSNVVDVVKRANAGHTVTFASRHIGRYTGMRIVAFQNAQLERNRTAQLDDCQLAAMMAIEFPMAVGRVFALNGAYATPDASAIRNAIAIVGGIRSDYNRTGHGSGAAPKTPVDRFGASRFDVPDASPAKPVNAKTRKSA